MKNTEDRVTDLMKLDFNLINESIRRLKEGTCCLNDDSEVEGARHLLNQTSKALESHFFIEESIFSAFSKSPDSVNLPEKFYEKMKAEHQQLREVLVAVKRELEEAHPIAFKATLTVFSETLNRHTELEITIPFRDIIKHVSPSYLEDIEQRVTRGYLD